MDERLLARVDAWLNEHMQEVLDDLAGLVRIPSVSDENAPVKPFGQPCRDALEYMFALGRRHGYATRNYDDRVGAIEFSRGDATVGIWTHLDVVPVDDPSLWDYPPFECTMVEGRYLIGRGVQDNKMPAVAVFHVMNCLRDLDMPLRHGYALYMGTNEECGMADARYFAARYPCPDLSIVPDCGFPVCQAQRGSMTLRLSVPLRTQVQLSQGNNPSVTPEEVRAVFADGRSLTARGKSAHVFAAEGLPNAALEMLSLLAKACPEDAPALEALRTLCADRSGGSLGLACADELSGALCMAPTRLTAADGRLSADVFCILPVSFDDGAALFRAGRAAEAQGVTMALTRIRRPASFPVEHPVVSLLTGVYNEVTGSDAAPYVMSGGNYAACLPNAIGFGPGMPGREFPPHIFREGHGDYHQCDESEDVAHIVAFMRVYAMSIAALEQTDRIRA